MAPGKWLLILKYSTISKSCMAGFLTPVLVLLSGDFELRQKFRYDLQHFSPPISMKFGMYVEVMVMDDIVIRPDPWSRSKT